MEGVLKPRLDEGAAWAQWRKCGLILALEGDRAVLATKSSLGYSNRIRVRGFLGQMRKQKGG